jgi:hypothetical protein
LTPGAAIIAEPRRGRARTALQSAPPRESRFAMRSALLLAFVLVGAVTFPILPSAESSPPETPPVLFNHFFAVTDAATYAEAQANRFLTKEFAPFEKRTTVRNDQTYTGIYFYGRHTYFELFEPGAQGPTGTSGLAFGVETPDGSAAVKSLWTEATGGAERGPVTRRTDTDEVPWFEMTFAKGGRPVPTTAAVLRVWLMEYHRDFLARWYPDLTPARSITRADVLDRYVARIGEAARRATFLMKDVTSLTLALPDEDRASLATQLRAVGYAAREDKGEVVLTGPDVRLRVVPADGEGRGVREAEFSLQARVPRAQHRFGSAILTVEADRARLRLGGETR